MMNIKMMMIRIAEWMISNKLYRRLSLEMQVPILRNFLGRRKMTKMMMKMKMIQVDIHYMSLNLSWILGGCI